VAKPPRGDDGPEQVLAQEVAHERAARRRQQPGVEPNPGGQRGRGRHRAQALEQPGVALPPGVVQDLTPIIAALIAAQRTSLRNGRRGSGMPS